LSEGSQLLAETNDDGHLLLSAEILVRQYDFQKDIVATENRYCLHERIQITAKDESVRASHVDDFPDKAR
jgi:hypothetical protein